jgi:hypothetical protein
MFRGAAFASINPPCSDLWIIMPSYRRRIPRGHRVIGDVSRHNRISPYNTIAAYRQLSPCAYDGSPMADPGSLPDSDCTAFGNTLIANWYCDVFIRMIVVHNNH